jgi:ribulose-phosphate 3-epimerase
LNTPLKEFIPYIELADFAHIMTIERIGAQGQPFDDISMERIRHLRTRYPNLEISIDGGVRKQQVSELSHEGVTRFCVGKVLESASNPQLIFEELALCITNVSQS